MNCVHGRQVGKCDTCELIDAEQRILELEAQVERLLKGKWNGDEYKAFLDLPVIAEIKAQAGRDAVVSALRLYGEPSMTVSEIDSLADRYANQIRQQAKDKL